MWPPRWLPRLAPTSIARAGGGAGELSHFAMAALAVMFLFLIKLLDPIFLVAALAAWF